MSIAFVIACIVAGVSTGLYLSERQYTNALESTLNQYRNNSKLSRALLDAQKLEIDRLRKDSHA